MKSKIRLAALAFLLCWGTFANAAVDAMEDCVSKVTIEGSFMAGRIFKASTFIPRSTQQDVMKRVAKTVLKEGLTISSIDKDLGILSASFSKRAIGSKSAMATTLSMTFEPKGDGVDGTATLSTPGGITVSSEDGNKKDLCGLLLQ